MQIKDKRAEEERRRDTGPVYLSADGLVKLEKQLERLKQNLPDLIAETTRTAAYGDRSDNAEYKDAKGRLRGAQWRILTIQDQLKRVVLIPTGPSATGAVQMGSQVTVESNGEEKTFHILGSPEANPDKGCISFQSPLGAALIDHKVGDTVSVITKSGTREYRIVKIN
jgi:transcription elongation factor GreA